MYNNPRYGEEKYHFANLSQQYMKYNKYIY